MHVSLSRDRSYPIEKYHLQQNSIAAKGKRNTNHNTLQALSNPPFPLLPLVNLPSQTPRLLSIPPHLALRLLAPQHRALERCIIRLALQLLALIRQAVEHSDLVLHDAALARVSVLARRAGVGVEAGAVAVRGDVRWPLLVDAFGGDLEERRPWRAGELEGWIHGWIKTYMCNAS